MTKVFAAVILSAARSYARRVRGTSLLFFLNMHVLSAFEGLQLQIKMTYNFV